MDILTSFPTHDAALLVHPINKDAKRHGLQNCLGDLVFFFRDFCGFGPPAPLFWSSTLFWCSSKSGIYLFNSFNRTKMYRKTILTFFPPDHHSYSLFVVAILPASTLLQSPLLRWSGLKICCKFFWEGGSAGYV
jgi:hypothetical protein